MTSSSPAPIHHSWKSARESRPSRERRTRFLSVSSTSTTLESSWAPLISRWREACPFSPSSRQRYTEVSTYSRLTISRSGSTGRAFAQPVFSQERKVSSAGNSTQGWAKFRFAEMRSSVQMLGFGLDEARHRLVMARNHDLLAVLGFSDHGSEPLFELICRHFFHGKTVPVLIPYCNRICLDAGSNCGINPRPCRQ
jgi:hypothetical protein